MMAQLLRSSQLVPKVLAVERTIFDDGHVRIWVRSRNFTGLCPSCGGISRRVDSQYVPRSSDLPLSGRWVSPHLTVRRSRCYAVLCGQQIFAERFCDEILGFHARRQELMQHLADGAYHSSSGTGLGGQPVTYLAQLQMLPVSNDTLLRVINRRPQILQEPLSVVGNDDPWIKSEGILRLA